MTALPTSRQRGARRESTSSAAPTGSTRVRKNSMANNPSGAPGNGSMRPRANTISHVDNTTLGLLAAANSSASRHDGMGNGLNNYSSMGGLSGVGNYQPRGMSTAARHHGNSHVLPKLETKNHGIDIGTSLRTAPPFGGFGGEMDMDSSMWFGPGSTVNPAQLHFSDSPLIGTFDSQSPFQQCFPGMRQGQATMDNDGNFGWLNNFENQMTFNNFNEQAIDGSSPSAISTGSPGGLSEPMLEGTTNPMTSSATWQNATITQAPFTPSYSLDLSAPALAEMYTGQLSPKSLSAQMATDQYFSSPSLASQTPLSISHVNDCQSGHPQQLGCVNKQQQSSELCHISIYRLYHRRHSASTSYESISTIHVRSQFGQVFSTSSFITVISKLSGPVPKHEQRATSKYL